MKNKLLLILCMMMLAPAAFAQTISMEHYLSYVPQQQIGISTQVFMQNHSDWIIDTRYGYDAHKTFSVNFGKSFEFSNKKIAAMTIPTIGMAVGSINGINLNFNQEIEWPGIYFSARFQYFFSPRDKSDNFFYTWNELGMNFSEIFFAGISLQGTLTGNKCFEINKGVVIGFTSERWGFPVYIFDPFSHRKNIMTGIFYKMNFQKPSHDRLNY